jgi:hypothetical protein
MRETGWSLSVAGVRYQRGVGPSKQQLLLSEVIRIDNSANNGGGSNLQKFCGPKLLMKRIRVNTVGSRPEFIEGLTP